MRGIKKYEWGNRINYIFEEYVKKLEDANQKSNKFNKYVFIDPQGIICWILNGKLHRDDGPALRIIDKYSMWFKHGKRHRIDGPAVEYDNGTRIWCFNGEIHRENLPAYISKDAIMWVEHGKTIKIEYLNPEYEKIKNLGFLDNRKMLEEYNARNKKILQSDRVLGEREVAQD